MAVCTNSIIHYTSTIDNLISILKNGFYPRFCRETIIKEGYRGGEQILADLFVPMVCFCDIPFTQIKKHSERYGKFAIGLSKEWARTHRIGPVLYLCKEAYHIQFLFENIQSALGTTWQEGIRNISLASNVGYAMEVLLTMVKNEKGYSYKGDKRVKDVLLYEEREWRYVASRVITGEKLYSLQKVEKEDTQQKVKIDKLNEDLAQQDYSLKFKINDISDIIVEKEDDREELIKKLKEIFSESLQDQLDILFTKINSLDKIESDF